METGFSLPQGLIRSKNLGGNAANGSVIVFLDAHVKPDPGWVFPILRHINTNYKRVVVPKIPILDATTWEVNRKAGTSHTSSIEGQRSTTYQILLYRND